MIGVLVAFLTYIEGAPLHNVLWGLFGFSVILVAPIIVYVAVMMALDRSKSAVVNSRRNSLAINQPCI